MIRRKMNMIEKNNPKRKEYCDKVIEAIKMISHVGDVIPLESNYDDYFAKTQLRHELRGKFFDFIKEEL